MASDALSLLDRVISEVVCVCVCVEKRSGAKKKTGFLEREAFLSNLSFVERGGV